TITRRPGSAETTPSSPLSVRASLPLVGQSESRSMPADIRRSDGAKRTTTAQIRWPPVRTSRDRPRAVLLAASTELFVVSIAGIAGIQRQGVRDSSGRDHGVIRPGGRLASTSSKRGSNLSKRPGGCCVERDRVEIRLGLL